MPFIQLLQESVLIARQATATALTASVVSTVPTSGAATSLPSGTGGTVASTTTPAPSPTATNTDGKSGGSSPLLFFVALGFGVVFTNLWIIVGVKYCFRYNARARQMRMANEADAINMEPVHHPRRRRREKKLMAIDEVNEKFPMVKYKTWVASRAKEGLPTRGGVDAPTSRPSSIRSVEAATTDLAGVSNVQTDHDNDTASVETKDKTLVIVTTTATDETVRPAAGTSTSVADVRPRSSGAAAPPAASVMSVDDEAADESASTKDALKTRTSDDHDHHSDDDGDEHINAALPPECVGTSGDTCAICIDTLEEDDDVRGLSCGHAFHAACLDPWLTSRRACCPLCKADYYTPKPRASAPGGGSGDASSAAAAAALGPSGIPGAGAARGDVFQRGINMPAQPGGAWHSMHAQGRGFPSRLFMLGPSNSHGSPFWLRPSPYEGDRSGLGGGVSASGAPVVSQNASNASTRPSLLNRIRNVPTSALHRWRGQSQSQPSSASAPVPPQQQGGPGAVSTAAPASGVTPSQLEAGVREVS